MSLHRGRMTKDVEILDVRELTRADLELLKEKRTAPIVQRFRDPHHNLARLIATGMPHREAAQAAGYSHSRVANLMADPTFQNLVEEKRGLVDKGFAEGVDEYFALITSNMFKAERQIAEHLDAADEEGELLPVRNLIAIGRDAADRTGYGKKQTNLNINADFASMLEKAIARSGKVIDMKPNAGGLGLLPSAGVAVEPDRFARLQPQTMALKRRA